MCKIKALLMSLVVAILLPYCFSLTQKEKRLLDKFDAQIVQLKLKLQTLKIKLTSKVDRLNKEISTTNKRINDDFLIGVNKIKLSQMMIINKWNDIFKSRTTKYREQLKGKVEHSIDRNYNEKYKSSKSTVDKTIYPFVKHLNKIGIKMREKICKSCIISYINIYILSVCSYCY